MKITASMAEHWINPDIFIYKGKQYEVDIKGRAKLIKAQKCTEQK